MTHRGIGIVLVAMGIVALGLIPQASAQWVVGGPGATVATTGQGVAVLNSGDPNAMRAAMEQFRTQMAQQLKEQLGASDDEWKVMQPKIEKVQESSVEVSSGMSVLAGMRFRQMNFTLGGSDANRPPSDVQKTAEDLKKLLDDKDAKPADIQAAMTAYRDARAKAKAALDKAREELKAILTVRQEAILLARGTLE